MCTFVMHDELVRQEIKQYTSHTKHDLSRLPNEVVNLSDTIFNLA